MFEEKDNELESVNAQSEETQGAPSPMQKKKTALSTLLDYVEMFVLAILVVMISFSFFFRICKVDGPSMNNTLQHGDTLLISDTFYTPKRGDIIVFHNLDDKYPQYNEAIVKRVIAVGGDTINIDFDTWTVTVTVMPLKNIADCFEKKYGDKVECVRSNFFSDSNVPTLKMFEKMLVNQVTKFLKYPYYGKIITFAMELFGPKISTEFSMNALIKNATKEGVNYLNSLGADMVVSTHWATNYYAVKSKQTPLTVLYSPDNFINPLFRYKCDLVLTSLAPGYEKAKKLRRFNDGNLKLVDVSIRKEAFDVSLDKLKNRKKLGLPLDTFTIIFAEGGYGIGKMEKI